jgi:hypothetical protein
VIGHNLNTRHKSRDITHNRNRMSRNIPPQWVAFLWQTEREREQLSFPLLKCEHRSEEGTAEFRGGNSINCMFSWLGN